MFWLVICLVSCVIRLMFFLLSISVIMRVFVWLGFVIVMLCILVIDWVNSVVDFMKFMVFMLERVSVILVLMLGMMVVVLMVVLLVVIVVR